MDSGREALLGAEMTPPGSSFPLALGCRFRALAGAMGTWIPSLSCMQKP